MLYVFIMIKTKSYFYIICLSLLLIVLSSINTCSITVNRITKFLKGEYKRIKLIKKDSKIANPAIEDDILKKIH